MYGEFELELPQSLDEALVLLQASKAAVLSGGTLQIANLRSGKLRPARLLSLDGLDELRAIKVSGNRISLGSRTTVSDIMRSPHMAAFAPSLLDGAARFAGQMVRNMATVGGNIACSSPAADLVPPLMSLDAEVTLASAARGLRKVALCDYYLGYEEDVRAPDELITAVSWQKPPKASANSFYKLARRVGDAISVVGVAVTLSMDGRRCTGARIALGAVAPVVLRARAAENALMGQVPGDDLIAHAAKLAVAATSPVDDLRASAAYRRQTTAALVRRLLMQGRDRLAGEEGKS